MPEKLALHIRLPFFTAPIISALLGEALAYDFLGRLSAGGLILTLICALLVGTAFGALARRNFPIAGLFEAGAFLMFGPLLTLGAFYIQADNFSWKPITASIPIGLLAMAAILVNELLTAKDSSKEGSTLVAKLGTQTSALVFGGIVTLAYIWVVALAIFGYGLFMLLALLPMFFAYKAALCALDHHDEPQFMLIAQRDTIIAHLATGLLLIVGVLV